jgi:hypothetical protein
LNRILQPILAEQLPGRARHFPHSVGSDQDDLAGPQWPERVFAVFGLGQDPEWHFPFADLIE